METLAATPAWRLTPHLYAWRTAGNAAGSGPVPAGLREGLADAAGAGFPAVECGLAWVGRPGRGSAHSGDELLAEVRSGLREHGLSMAAVFVSIGTDADEATVAAVADLTRRVAAELDVRVLNTVTVPTRAERGGHPVTWDGPTDLVAGTLAALARAVEPYGTRVCWHPHDVSLSRDAHEARRVLAAAGSAPVRVCLDTGWAERSGTGTERALDVLADRVASLHLRDLTSTGEWCTALGAGVLDLAGLTGRLTRGGFAGPAAVELMPEQRGAQPLALDIAAADSARALAEQGYWRLAVHR
jgi:sugar phosphate isomerase/epimerase